MGRNLTLIVTLIFLVGCSSAPLSREFQVCKDSEVVLLPHHLLVEEIIEDMYLALDEPEQIVIVSPNHFSTGREDVIKGDENEFGFTEHRDFSQKYFPGIDVEGWMIKFDASQESLVEFVDYLVEKDALFVFSVDFSHYIPGQIAYVHDVRSADVIEARAIEDASSLEVDSPASIEVMLRLLEARGEKLKVLKNTNPSLDTGYENFLNTTHLFGCSFSGNPPERQVMTTMNFANDEQWYAGKTEEDRYLYGYDKRNFSQGGEDNAFIEYLDGRIETMSFNYF